MNPHASHVQSVQAYESVSAIPGEVDLAVLAVPRNSVLPAARECVKKGVRALVVITAGFRETGEEGGALERELTTLVRASGVRMVGPNCLGILNTDPGIPLKQLWAEAPPNVAGEPWPRLDGYDKVTSSEVLRVPLTRAKAPATPAEKFLITFEPPKGGATAITFTWGDQSWTTDIKAAK